MSSASRWALSFLGIFCVLMTRPTSAYEYVQDIDTSESEDDPADSSTSTRIEWTFATSSGEIGGECSCDVATHTWATGSDSATAESSSSGTWRKSWQWDGPPGTTAPGGTLSWSYSGWGTAEAYGHVDLGEDGSGTSVAHAESATHGSGTGTGANADYTAHGAVYDNDYGSGSLSGSASPTGYYWLVPDAGAGWYDYSIDWSNNDSAQDYIASGTSYVYFGGGAGCYNYSGAGAGPTGTEADARSDASANVSLAATFTSN